MNVPSANDDHDFPVFKAGPPLPIRAKTKPNCKIKSSPLKAPLISQHRSSAKPSAVVSNSTPTSAESKVKQYIEQAKASDELARKKRVKPEQMLSLEELYQVNNDVLNVKGDIPAKNRKQQVSLTEVQDKLRETLRIVKEKDELIIKLRESCHDLAIKCADAENRVDELRFSYGRSSVSVGAEKDTEDLNIGSMPRYPLFANMPRRCISAEGLNTCDNNEDAGKLWEEKKTSWAKIDKATETNNEVTKYDAQTQMEAPLCPTITLPEQQVGEWQPEDDILQETCSNWMEKVKNWKTDSNFNLSQDSGGDKDSGFRGSSAEIDAESIAKNRSSSLLKTHRRNSPGERSLLPVPSSHRKNTTQLPQLSASSTTTTITAAAQAVCDGEHHHDETDQPHLAQQQHFWPSFNSSLSNSHLSNYHSGNFQSDSTKAKSLFYEMAEADRNKYSCFQENHPKSPQQHLSKTPSQQNRISESKSLDGLYVPSTTYYRHTTEELKSLIDSSFDPPEFILKSHLNLQHRSIDKKVKMLGPLLDDTTQIALRVKMKSERLAKMLNDACALE